MPSNKPPLAEIVSLADFRERVRPDEHDQLPPCIANYRPIDYTTFHMARRMVSGLLGEIPAKRFGVVEKTTNEPNSVAYSTDGGYWFAVERNRNDKESLTLDLEYGDEATEARLRLPLERFHLLSLIADHVLVAEKRINLRGQLPNPVAGEVEINIDDDSKRQQKINTLRSAAGLAVLAVGHERPKLRFKLRQYVNEVLAGRLQYIQSLGSLSVELGVETPEMTNNELQLRPYI